uniref:Aquaporin n=1 Tax=Sparus aurata TaxID=8175 RepID=A0A671UGN9_SPAAU
TADVAVSLVLIAGILVSTFQLCCCTHELRLLSEVGGIEPRLALTLTYLAAVIHGLTFSGAIGNPSAAVPVIWSVCMSGLHARHKLLGYRCISPIHAPLPKAAAVELACAFAVQTAITHTRSVEEKYRVHAVTAAIATVSDLIFIVFLYGHSLSLTVRSEVSLIQCVAVRPFSVSLITCSRIEWCSHDECL